MNNQRVTRAANIELRADLQGEDLVLCGRAFAYGKLSEPGVPEPGCKEQILRGAFTKSLGSGRVVTADFNHSNSFLPLATTRNRTLELDDRTDGLHFVIHLDPKVSAHKDVHRLVQAGTISECSFAFSADDDQWTNVADDPDRCFMLRSVRKAVLYGISLVNTPAYGDGATNVQARSLAYCFAPLQRKSQMSDVELRERVARLGREIQDANIRDAVERSKVTGWKEVWIGPGPADVRFEPMSDAEYSQHLRNRAESLGHEIKEQRRAQERIEPSQRIWSEKLNRFLEPWE